MAKEAEHIADVGKQVDPMEEFVPVKLFKDNGRYKDDVFVAVNGQSVTIKRGESVMIKRKFAEVLMQSEKQDAAAAAMMDKAEEEYRKNA